MLPTDLHRHHLAHDSKAKGWRVDLGRDATIRIESTHDTELKKAIALRVAVCWNICEAIPTDALLDGVVRDCYCTARALCEVVEREPGLFSAQLRELAAKFRTADKALADVTTDVDCDCGTKGTT